MFSRVRSVAHPDPHYFWKLDPDRIRVNIWIRIRIKVKIQQLLGLKIEPWRGPLTLTMQALEAQNRALDVYKPVVADSDNFDEEQDPDPDPHLIEKLDPDPH